MSRYLSMVLLTFFLVFPGVSKAQGVTADSKAATAVFAGGCFWCMESEFSDLKGVKDVVSGYAGGEGPAPTYEEVSSGQSGFKEAILVTYDPSTVSYQTLLDIFWSNVDPFDDKGQFCDKGSQYIAAIFTGSAEEKLLAEQSLKKVEDKFKQKVATQILPKTSFYPAEEYHQDYYLKSADRYKRYRKGCGRDAVLDKLWGDQARTGEAATQ